MTKKEIALNMAIAHAQVEYAERLKKDSYKYGGSEPIENFYDLVKRAYVFFSSFCDLDIERWSKDQRDSFSTSFFKQKQMNDVTVEVDHDAFDINITQRENDMNTDYVVIHPDQVDILIKWLEEAREELINYKKEDQNE